MRQFSRGSRWRSRAYYFDGSRLKRLTDDHSNVFRLVIQGKLTEEEGRVHPCSNLINRAIGLEEDVEAEVQSILYSGETILLCTDGLTDMLPKKETEKLFLEHSDLNTLCDLLIRKANQGGGRDNITAILACPGNTG
ncbi:MAG TPA: serine/threonine-protein phosphatase [Deltaproteobacteria bacterium]|nr:serine/threonine-protein phosphatase [Deltaproteobacteria bacterium]